MQGMARERCISEERIDGKTDEWKEGVSKVGREGGKEGRKDQGIEGTNERLANSMDVEGKRNRRGAERKQAGALKEDGRTRSDGVRMVLIRP